MKRTVFTLLFSLCAAPALLAGCNFGGSNNDDPVDADLRIGALVDLSGDSSIVGSQTESAVLQAAKAGESSGVIVGIEVRDTGSDPTTAVQAMQELIDMGIRVFVGPSTSAEAQAVLPLANAYGALLVSESSTAQSLAIPNDALYRLVPTSNVEAQASVDYMKARGRSALITVSRQDAGNLEATSAVRTAANSSGFSLQPGITYPVDHGTDFNDVAQQIATAVTAVGGGAGVAVYVAGFDEVADLLADSAGFPELQNIAFYGSDGVALNTDITSSARPSFFAVQADGMASPLISIAPNAAAQAQDITDEAGGTTPNAFVMNAYDAVVMMTNAYLADSTFGDGGQAARSAFVRAANGYSGLTGTIQLNSAGDRTSAPYTMWGDCYVNGLTNWYAIGSWTPFSPTSTKGTASYSGCPAS
jgi:branched-chain amino acid transport system substrate-binding protein